MHYATVESHGDPEAVFKARRRDIEVTYQDGRTEKYTSDDPLEELRKMLCRHHVVHLPSLPRFTGGIVGYAGYDMVRYYEDIGDGPQDDLKLPDLSFGLYRTMVIFDHVSKTIKVVART